MKQKFVADYRAGDRLDESFLVKFKALQAGRTGRAYLTLTVMDRTGEVQAKVWDNAEAAAARVEKGDVARVTGEVVTYQDRIQFKLFELERLPEAAYSLSDYLPVSRFSIERMLERLDQMRASIADPGIRAVVDALFDDPVLRARFARSSAARSVHHAFVGGLLEHTLGVAGIVSRVVEIYPSLNRDLLLAGALLHDIGKVAEYSVEQGFEQTDQGRLIGHLVIGAEMIAAAGRSLPDVPASTIDLLRHLVLAHHGAYEFGSPKLPMVAEAFVLHYADNIDAKVNIIAGELEKLPAGERWSGHVKSIDTSLFRPDRDGREGPA